MIRRPPGSTRTDTRFPYPTPSRSATPVLRRTLQEAVDNLDDLASVITGLDGFNRGWACAADGNYLNFVFPLTPELATVDINPGICDNVEEEIGRAHV